MALESPLVTSPSNLMSTLSPYTDFSLSPNSPGLPNNQRFQSLFRSARSSTDESSLRPKSLDAGLSPAAQMASPSDMVGPSPVTSNGTESTDIEDDASEVQESPLEPPKAGEGLRMNTDVPAYFRSKQEDEPDSVIHAPQGYMNFANPKNINPPTSPPTIDRSTPKPYEQGQILRHSKLLPSGGDKTITSSPVSPPTLTTNISPPAYPLENSTPRAQTRQEIDVLSTDKARLRSSSASSLEGTNNSIASITDHHDQLRRLAGIPEDARESDDNEDYSDLPPVQSPDHEVNALKTALHECWTLCNTLASLSSIHRERIFSYSGTGDAHEKAWKCCWRLCQKLYEGRDNHQDLEVGPTLDLCRDFCQALFDVRQHKDEIADSVLRVSFELNNHLFNTHDRNLPEAFRERTLDFYITLCHRLMKQRSELAEETDSLLRACWSLAEMLFSLRQNRREGKPADEELLGSAVQACWELCDLFREGWTQVRPERGTPRPSQTTFSQSFDQLSRSSHTQNSSLSSLPSLLERTEPRFSIPETPTTEFEDTPISPEDNSPSIPNILVLGTEGNRSSTARWSSNSSNLSGYSQGSAKTSSTIKTAPGVEDANLTRLKILILKAAMNVGFNRSAMANGPTSGGTNALQAFVKSLPVGSFGSLAWHSNLLTSYKDLVLSDPAFRSASNLPSPGKRASAPDVAKSVGWMMRSGQYIWLQDLFRLVFGFHADESDKRKNVGITV